MTKRALTIARFQPFHNGHYETIKRMKNDGYDEIIIGIGSSEVSTTPKNPFTCSERMEMIYSVLKYQNFKHYFLVPIRDVNDNDLWVSHVKRLVPEFDTVYSGNPLLIRLFTQANYNVVFDGRRFVKDYRKDPAELVPVSATKIRELMVNDDNFWEEMVPERAYESIMKIDGVKRIKEIYAMINQI
jgi:nicotinamide-nucleotide adenylyltransferase